MVLVLFSEMKIFVYISSKELLIKFLKEKVAESDKLQFSNFSLVANTIENILQKIFSSVKTFIYGPHIYGLGCFKDKVKIFIDIGELLILITTLLGCLCNCLS